MEINGFQVILSESLVDTTKRIQKRKHRKKRINKKWQKRYGFVYAPSDKVIVDNENYKIFVHPIVWKKLKRGIEDGKGMF